MLTVQQFRDTLVAEKLILEPVGSGWVAKTAKGERLVRTPVATPELAVEQAKAALDAARDRTEVALSVRTIQELQRGEVYVRPRDETDPVSGALRRVFDVVGFDGSPTAVTGRASYVEAVEEYRVAQPVRTQPSRAGDRLQ